MENELHGSFDAKCNLTPSLAIGVKSYVIQSLTRWHCKLEIQLGVLRIRIIVRDLQFWNQCVGIYGSKLKFAQNDLKHFVRICRLRAIEKPHIDMDLTRSRIRNAISSAPRFEWLWL